MRLSPSGRLVLLSVVIAVVLASWAGGTIRDSAGAAGPPATAAVLPAPTAATTGSSSVARAERSAATASTPPPSSARPEAPGSLADRIAALPVTEERRAGYDRDLFRLWIDEDGDGCDTRHEVLIAEAVSPPDVGTGCHLTGGHWTSPYDGVGVTDSAKLDIDHLVPLAEAWDSGASAWTSDEREAYANDLGVPWALIAVTAASNRSKGDRDPAEWMPPLASYACTYVADWVAVKVRWRLSVDPIERQALDDLAVGCPDAPR